MSYQRSLKILIADDSDTDRLLLKAIIMNQGHEPLLASDGQQAVDLFLEHRPDVVLLDALMPKMDGFEAARFIKKEMGEIFVPVIFLTSLSEADSLAKCLDAGGDDFLTKPYHSVILRAKIDAFSRMSDMNRQLLSQKEQIESYNQRLVHEQEVAKLTFDKIAHEGALSSSSIRYSLSPKAIFNGDVLLAAFRPDGNLCILMGDFTGHGLSAAVGAMPLSQTFYSMTAKGFGIRDIVAELNKKMKEILPIGVFCCACVLDISYRNETVEIWNGGMPDTIIYSAKKQSPLSLPAEHMPLGILSDEQFNTKTIILRVGDRDKIYLCSDGILEAENSQGEMFGADRLMDVFMQPADDYFDAIISAANNFVGEQHFADDLSIAEISMLPTKSIEPVKKQLVLPIAQPDTDCSFSFELRNKHLRSADPMPILQRILDDIPSLKNKVIPVFTVLTELFSNALEHGVLDLQSEMKDTPGGFSSYYQLREERLASLDKGFIRFDVDFSSDADVGRLEITITDSGQGFDYKDSDFLSVKNDDGYMGRGLVLVKHLTNQFEFLEKGNKAKAVFVI